MYKKYLLKCSVFSASNGWKDENIYFDYIGEIVCFIKHGGVYDGIFVKPEYIKVESVFKLDKVNIEEFLKWKSKIKIKNVLTNESQNCKMKSENENWKSNLKRRIELCLHKKETKIKYWQMCDYDIYYVYNKKWRE